MRQEYRHNKGDRWQVTTQAEKEKRVEKEKWAETEKWAEMEIKETISWSWDGISRVK